jgi:hypothetical protein
MNLGSWLMTGSGGMQAPTERVIDQAWLAELATMHDVESFKEETYPFTGESMCFMPHCVRSIVRWS